jgi:ribosomal protein S18 acetylase RimI-like enzyme
LERHASRDGFRFVAALMAGGSGISGFGYGYVSQAGQWWHDQVVEQLDEGTIAEWFADAFEIVELAVRPDMQGYGIGGRLHDLLLRLAPQRTAVLSTLDADTRGFRLYHSRGWRVIRDGFHFRGVHEPYLIMGLRLADFTRTA